MIRTRWRVWLLTGVCLAQLAVPAFMLAARERTLARGERFLFRCELANPADALHGRYVALRLPQRNVAVPPGSRFPSGERVFVRVTLDADGFAELSRPSHVPPATGPYVKATAELLTGNGVLRLKLPFDRYYVEESIASGATRILHEGERGPRASIAVRLLDGNAVLEELYLDDLPFGEYLSK